MQQSEQKRTVGGEIAAVLAIFVAISAAGYALPPLFLLLPLPGIYLGARYGVNGMAIVLGIAAAAGGLLLGMAAIPLFGILAAAVILPAVAIRKKLGAYESLVLSCGAGALGAGILLLWVQLAAGQDLVSFLTTSLEAALPENESLTAGLYFLLRSSDVLSGALSPAEFLLATQEEMLAFVSDGAQMEQIRQTLTLYVPVLLVYAVILGGLLWYLVPRAFAKRQGTPVAPVPPFSLFYLPKKAAPYFVGMFLLSILPTLAGWKSLELAGVVLLNALMLIFSVQGLSLIEYFLRPRIASGAVRGVILVVCYLVLSTLLSFAGLIEQVFRIRERQQNIGRSNRE